jgi:hypothetical protein
MTYQLCGFTKYRKDNNINTLITSFRSFIYMEIRVFIFKNVWQC